MKNSEEELSKHPPFLTDLRSITRDSDRCETTVIIETSWDRKIKWLVFGQATLTPEKEGRWRLEARITSGVTDFEHDSAYALRLPLIGVHLTDLAVHYHTTNLEAWVDPNLNLNSDFDKFHVPSPGYNPMEHPKAVKCTDKMCLKDDPKSHLIVPEGFYVPPNNPVLYKAVRGKRVEIRIGPVFKEE